MRKGEIVKEDKYSLSPHQQAHQTLFLRMISSKEPKVTEDPELDALCQTLRDANQLEAINPETGATLLGIATTLLLPRVVLKLLKYGADINLPTGLVNENCLPFTIALKRKAGASIPQKILLPSSSVPSAVKDSRFDAKEIAQRRSSILQIFLQHPKLNLNQQDPTGKTVFDWVEGLGITTITSHDGFVFEKIKSFRRRLDHQTHYGLNDLRESFKPVGTLQTISFSKIKRTQHTYEYPIFIDFSSIWIMKFVEDNKLPNPDKQDLRINTPAPKEGLTIHQQVWAEINENENQYQIYSSPEGQIWGCGRFAISETSIVLMPAMDLDTKEITTKKVEIIKDIRGRLQYARCLRETVAMEWHRLFNSTQPCYMTVVDRDMATAVVVSREVSESCDFDKAYSRKTEFTYLTGLANVLCDILITNDVDPNCHNFLFLIKPDKKAIIHIDGDRCWGRLREYTPVDRFSLKQSITELLEQKSLGENGYYFWNFFDKIELGQVKESSPIYDWLLSMVKTPSFKMELYQALLKRIFLPKSFIDTFVSYYIPKPYEPISLQDELSSRLTQVREAALDNKDFKAYLRKSQPLSVMEDFLKSLPSFDIRSFTYFCSPEDKHIRQIRTIFNRHRDGLKAFHIALGRAEAKNIENLYFRVSTQPKDLDLRNREIGATPLGLAIAFLMPQVVEELLRQGADANLAPNLKEYPTELPLTIAVVKTHRSEIKDLYLDDSKIPQDEPHNDKDCNCAFRRIKIILALLACPNLDLAKKNGNGETVLEYWPELKDNEPALYDALTQGIKNKDPLVAYRAYAISTLPSVDDYFDIIKQPDDDKPSQQFITIVSAYDFLTEKDKCTSHTLLGLAITLFKPNYVSALLEAKADINQPTGEAKYRLPITIAAINHRDDSIIMDRLLSSPQLQINTLEKIKTTTCLDFITTASKSYKKLVANGAKTFAQLSI